MITLNNYKLKILILAACLWIIAGCILCDRRYVTVDVNEIDQKTKTTYQYEIFEFRECPGSSPLRSRPSDINSEARRLFPGVFKVGGVPIIVDKHHKRPDPNDHHMFVLGPFMLFIPIPLLQWGPLSENIINLSLLEESSTHSEFKLSSRINRALSILWPTSLCLCGDGGESGKPSFTVHSYAFCSDRTTPDSQEINQMRFKETVEFPVCGIVAKLKEMEEKGIINDDVVRKAVARRAEIVEQRKRAEAEAAAKLEQERQRREAEDRKRQSEREEAERQRQKELEERAMRRQIEQTLRPDPVPEQNASDQVGQKPPYRLVKCEREKGSEYAYAFEVELINVTTDPIRMFGAIQYRFADTIRNMYALSYPSKDSRRLEIEFSDYSLSDNRIRGRAVVLEITPMTLSYDANTRRGKMSVRLNANQYEEARKWIRKNIETLARDKNIALTTGVIPPAARFYLGREELKDGNVLEIEFKTE